MIVLIAISAWIFALVLVAGLCAAARRGDRAQLEGRSRAVARRQGTAVFASRQSTSALAHAEGLAPAAPSLQRAA